MNTRKTIEHTGTASARDANGQRHQIDVYTTFLHITMLDGKTERTAGMMQLRLKGAHLNLLDTTTVENPATGQRLTLDHPLRA